MHLTLLIIASQIENQNGGRGIEQQMQLKLLKCVPPLRDRCAQPRESVSFKCEVHVMVVPLIKTPGCPHNDGITNNPNG